MIRGINDGKLGAQLGNANVYSTRTQQATRKLMIRHTVMFTPKHEAGTEAEKRLLEAAQKLDQIATVKKFEILRHVSSKCEHRFGLSMEFDDEDTYQFYNEHPEHVAFVNDIWIPEVESWQEIDYVIYEG